MDDEDNAGGLLVPRYILGDSDMLEKFDSNMLVIVFPLVSELFISIKCRRRMLVSNKLIASTITL
jgi:hypothetical protein